MIRYRIVFPLWFEERAWAACAKRSLLLKIPVELHGQRSRLKHRRPFLPERIAFQIPRKQIDFAIRSMMFTY